MSHYISAGYGPNEGESIEFSLGVGHRTLSALEDSGFDLYGLYQAYEFHNGMSGSGGEKTVDKALATSVFVRECIWAKLFSEKWPKAYSEYNDNESHQEHLSIIGLVDETYEGYVKTLKEVQFELDHMSERSLDRAIGYISSVMHFTKWIFDTTQKGHKVRLYFFKGKTNRASSSISGTSAASLDAWSW